MKHIIFTLFVALLLVACEVTPETEFTDRPVVCCYLSEGESPILTIQKLIPFQGDATFSDEDINRLNITITDLTTSTNYLLYNIGDGTYCNKDFIAESGHEYKLNFLYDGVEVEASTTVPSAPQNVSFSSTTIGVMSFDFKSTSATRAPNDGIEITWSNEDGDYYIVEGKTNSTSSIRDIDDDEQMPAKSFKLNYTQGSSSTLSLSDFNYFGSYEISVIHINSEYAIMSQGGSTSSTTLLDVKGNIDGGYGIFTGISSVTRSINVTKQSAPF